MPRPPRLPAGLPPVPICVLLLPRRLEAFPLRPQAEDLLRAPGVVAVDPAPVSYRAFGRMPELLAETLAAGQARRLKLPGEPRAVVIFHPLQYLLARSVLALNAGCELWYGLPDDGVAAGGRARVLHEAASQRAALTFDADERADVREANRPLFARMEALGVQSGRLGGERAGAAGS